MRYKLWMLLSRQDITGILLQWADILVLLCETINSFFIRPSLFKVTSASTPRQEELILHKCHNLDYITDCNIRRRQHTRVNGEEFAHDMWSPITRKGFNMESFWIFKFKERWQQVTFLEYLSWSKLITALLVTSLKVRSRLLLTTFHSAVSIQHKSIIFLSYAANKNQFKFLFRLNVKFQFEIYMKIVMHPIQNQ